MTAMRGSGFAPAEIGMNPAAFLTQPMRCDAAEFERVMRACVKAGFRAFSLWTGYVTEHGIQPTRALIDDLGARVRVFEAITRWAEGPGTPIDEAESQLDVAAAFGADIVLAIMRQPIVDFGRTTAGFADLCGRAARRGQRVVIEFIPCRAVPDLATAWRIVREAGATNGGLVLDMMHWQYQPGGPDFDLLRRIPGEHVTYVQLCDAAAGPAPADDDYLRAAMSARAVPGDGVVDIAGIVETLSATGAEPFVAYEVFNAELAARGAEVMAKRLRTVADGLFS
jgi:sugar phosphate isomerase/epimerase